MITEILPTQFCQSTKHAGLHRRNKQRYKVSSIHYGILALPLEAEQWMEEADENLVGLHRGNNPLHPSASPTFALLEAGYI